MYAGRAARLSQGGASTPAERALREALADGPLSIVALGPLTNIAAALRDRLELQANVKRIVAVMGRRPGWPAARLSNSTKMLDKD